MELAASVEAVTRGNVQLRESATRFEVERVQCIRQSLKEMVWSEITFHARYNGFHFRSLELLTEAHALLLREDVIDVSKSPTINAQQVVINQSLY